MKWREIVYDIITDLQQAFDDSSISSFSVIYWVSVHADRLKAQHIEKRDSGAFLTHYSQILVNKELNTNRKYIIIPQSVYDYDNDNGINFISYDYTADDCNPAFTSVTFTRTSPTQSKLLYWTEEERPKPDNPYWYRIKDNLYLLGIEAIDVVNVEVALYTTFNPRNIIDLDTECDFPQELISILIRQVLDLGRFVLTIPNDKANDGNDTIGNMPKSKLLSVNDNNAVQQQQQQSEQQ
jgi:hypothetical protein